MSTAPLPSLANRSKSGLKTFARFADVGLAVGMVGVIVVLVIPIPTYLLDILLCCQLTLSLSILLGTLYCNEPLEFSGFPSMLLFVTLFRLSMNVASSRLILLQGDAGEVIRAFGDFVVGGNYIVGIAIFLILVAIQFVVITKGASRVAEVAARFTLDAMPGKQMAIDADLNAGLIDEQQARLRRQKIEQEASFFGAMDGASKFVRGDAIASILVTVINILGGLGIGVLQRDMELVVALKHYTLLTIGDGLITQIPALLVSTASGVLVTRSSSKFNLGEDLSRQLLLKARPIQISGCMVLLFSLVPGLPTIPFLFLAAILFGLGWAVGKNEASMALAGGLESAGGEAESPGGQDPGGGGKGRPGRKPNPVDLEKDQVDKLLKIDTLELELGTSLISLVDGRASGDLLNRISQIRKRMASELGIVIPPVRVRDNLQLPPRDYRVRIRGAVMGGGHLYPERLLAIDPGSARPGLQGVAAEDPAFGLPGKWIDREQRGRAEAFGYTVVDAASVLSTHFHEILRCSSSELLSRQDVQKMVEQVKESDPALVKDVIPNQIGLPVLHRVLQGLLAERVPIRDRVTILENLGDLVGKGLGVESLVEQIRVSLAPAFVRNLEDQQGKLTCVALDPALESRLIQSLVQTDRGPSLVLTPLQVPRLLKAIEEQYTTASKARRNVALLCSAGLRPHIRRLLERSLPKVPILSYLEIPKGTQLDIAAQVPVTVMGEANGGLFGRAPVAAGN